MFNGKIFITGLPHSGKSTLLSRLIDGVKEKQGFLTLEMQEDNQRTGFKIVTASGREAVLASINLDTPIKVSRYSVSVGNLDKVIPELENFNPGDILYLDEIGQMELYSDKFKQLVRDYLEAPNPLLATISQVYSDDFTKEILERDGVELLELTPENREETFHTLAERMR